MMNNIKKCFVLSLMASFMFSCTDIETIDLEKEAVKDLYDETLDGWKEGIEWAVKEKVWDDVNFDNLFTTIKDTETESTTEQATE